MTKKEIEKDDNYWKGYIQKQKEAEEICKMCKYRKRYKELTKKEEILDKLTDKLKEDIENNYYIEELTGKVWGATCTKRYQTKQYAKEILNIIEGEKK